MIGYYIGPRTWSSLRLKWVWELSLSRRKPEGTWGKERRRKSLRPDESWRNARKTEEAQERVGRDREKKRKRIRRERTGRGREREGQGSTHGRRGPFETTEDGNISTTVCEDSLRHVVTPTPLPQVHTELPVQPPKVRGHFLADMTLVVTTLSPH